MKKALFTSLAMVLAGSALAEQTPVSVAPSDINTQISQVLAQGEKVAMFGTLNKQNGTPVFEAYSEFSRLAGPDFCWVAKGFTAGSTQSAFLEFSAPVGSNFVMPGVFVERSEDGKKHALAFKAPANAQGEITQCWKFDSKDSLGQYSATLQVGTTSFPTFNFTVVK
ncbi:MAG: hypothetical protein Q4E16_06950 [Neisseria sp.]|nr:hypothetical protein [Neisseria sp.]